MNRTGAFAASGIAATHKGTVTPRSAVLIGKPFYLIPHFEAAISTVNEAGKNALDAICGFRFADLLLTDISHSLPGFARNDWLMRSFHTNPFLLGLRCQLAVFIR